MLGAVQKITPEDLENAWPAIENLLARLFSLRNTRLPQKRKES